MKSIFKNIVARVRALPVFRSKKPVIPVPENCLVVSERTGRTALSEIFYLNGSEIRLKDAYAAQYKYNSGSLYLWATFSETESEAYNLYAEVLRKVMNNPAFGMIKKMMLYGVTVFKVSGMGADSFFFRRGSGNYWLSVKNADSDLIAMMFARRISLAG